MNELVGRTFAYRLGIDGEDDLFIVSTVLEPEEGMKLPEGFVWVKAYSENAPSGEYGTAEVGLLKGEIGSLMAHAAQHWFEDKVNITNLAKKFPRFEYPAIKCGSFEEVHGCDLETYLMKKLEGDDDTPPAAA